MLQVFILHKDNYMAILGKRNNKEVFLDVNILNMTNKPRYTVYLEGIKRAVRIVKNSMVYKTGLDENESICFVLGCNNVLRWFLKQRAVEPYVQMFNEVCAELDELTTPINFLYNNTSVMERRYCRKENIEVEENETIGAFLMGLKEKSNKEDTVKIKSEEAFNLFVEALGTKKKENS